MHLRMSEINLKKISRLAVVDPSEKTTACELNEMVTPERFLESIENRDPSCLVKINPNILPDGKWNIWAKLIKADANFALGDVETGRQILNEIPESSGNYYVEGKIQFFKWRL